MSRQARGMARRQPTDLFWLCPPPQSHGGERPHLQFLANCRVLDTPTPRGGGSDGAARSMAMMRRHDESASARNGQTGGPPTTLGCGVTLVVIKCTNGALTSERKCGVYSVSVPSRSGVSHRTHVKRLWSAWAGSWSTWSCAGSTKGETCSRSTEAPRHLVRGKQPSRRPGGASRRRAGAARAAPAPGRRRHHRGLPAAPTRGLTGRSRFGQLRCDSVRVTLRAVVKQLSLSAGACGQAGG